MRLTLAGLALLTGASTASAEVWLMREGPCGNWRSRWNVEQDQSGVWVGTIDAVHVGGPCAQGDGQRFRSEVRAVIAGDSLFASRRRVNGTFCSYYATIQGERGRGFELCEQSMQRAVFALRFPPGGDREARLRHEQRSLEQQDDDWLDNPQTLDRDRAPPGFNFESRFRPR